MKSTMPYLERTRRMADNTPATRNRVVDLWRVVAILGVVIGHWLAASIWVTPDGAVTLRNILETLPGSSWLTWIVQVMPVFFFVGGFSNARAWTRADERNETAHDWVIARVRRLFTPVVPLLVVWSIVVVAARGVISADMISAGAVAATTPLWFMAVYLVLTALVPLTHRWWRSAGMGSVCVLAVGAVSVDLLRSATNGSLIGYANYLLVWAGLHQLGYWWEQRGTVPTRIGALVTVGSLAVLVAVTLAGWYPVAMIGIPGAGPTNMTPPTAAIGLLGVAQAGVIWWSAGQVSRIAARSEVWHGVVGLSGVAMTLYLWHLTAMALVAGVGLFVFDGAVFQIEPGALAWWLTRPLWLAVLAGAMAPMIAVLARFEHRLNQTSAPPRAWMVGAGVALAAVATAGVALSGLVDPIGNLRWWILAAALGGALLLDAIPTR